MTGKLVVALLLTALSSSAAAEWVRIGIGYGVLGTIYVDSATIRRTGNMVKMWELFDLTTADKLGSDKLYLSVKSQSEYDCIDESARSLYASFHSGNMGRGELVYVMQDLPGNWQPVPPQSNQQALWKVACGKP